MGLYVWRLSFHIPLSVCVLSCVWLFVTLWTIARQAPLSMGFSRQEYWSGLLFIPPGHLLKPGLESMSPAFPALGGGFFTTWETLISFWSTSICLSKSLPTFFLFNYINILCPVSVNHFFLNILYIFSSFESYIRLLLITYHVSFLYCQLFEQLPGS